MNQGRKANITGNQLERFIHNLVTGRGYLWIEPRKFKVATYLEQPIFTRQYVYGENIYGGEQRVDFILYHPDKYPNCLIIEAKWQQKAGSVEEKFPYFYLNIMEKYPTDTVMVLAGGAYRPGAEQWLRDRMGNKLIHVFNMEEFQTWVNNENI
jgi:hypothetical protein